MNPAGAADPLYILARRVLLDALEAVGLLERLFARADASGSRMAP